MAISRRARPRRGFELTPVQQAHAFKKVYILTGPATYSAAVNFARLVRLGNSNAVIVGEETGSPGDGHSAEILLTYKLPASGLLFEIPLVRVAFAPVVAGQKPARGLCPILSSLKARQILFRAKTRRCLPSQTCWKRSEAHSLFFAAARGRLHF
jgi:hypothetical protein